MPAMDIVLDQERLEWIITPWVRETFRLPDYLTTAKSLERSHLSQSEIV